MSNIVFRIPMLLWVIGFIVFNQCAHIEPPSGGPADDTPPYIVAVYPPPASVNQPRELKVTVKFSEWINKDLGNNQVVISPALSQKLRLKNHGDQLEISTQSLLDTNTTYVLTFLNTITDLHGLRMEKSYALMFSTGDRIDSLTFKGSVRKEGKPFKNVLIGMYPVGGKRERLAYLTEPGNKVPAILPHPAYERPMFLMSADSTGFFRYKGLRPDVYGIIAFNDVNGNLRPDLGTEQIAIGDAHLQIQKNSTQHLRLAPYDTVRPSLLSAAWKGEQIDSLSVAAKSHGTLHLKFSDDMNPKMLFQKGAYAVTTSDLTDTIPILGICRNPHTLEMELWLPPLPVDSVFMVTCVKGEDRFGNTMDTSKIQLFFKPGNEVDTLPMKLTPLSFKNGDSAFFLRKPLEFYSNKILTGKRMGELKKDIICYGQDSIPLPAEISRVNHHMFQIVFPKFSYNGQKIKIMLNEEKMLQVKKVRDTSLANRDSKDSLQKAASPDTVAYMDSLVAQKHLVGWFTLANDQRWGRCKITQRGQKWPWTLVFQGISPKRKIVKKAPIQSRAIIDSLPEGKYFLSYYKDDNANNYWDAGRVVPWTRQELAGSYKDTININFREVFNIVINWPPKESEL